MKGYKFETLEESWDNENMEKYLNWEMSNLKACQSDRKFKEGIFRIFMFGQELQFREDNK